MNRRPLMQHPLVQRTALAFLAGGAIASTAGCSSSYTEEVYCVLDDGTVVKCDGDNDFVYIGGYSHPVYIWTSSTHYPVGSRVPQDWRSTRMRPSDSAARARAGLSSSGKIGSRTVTRSSGGFGFGGHGDSGGG